VEPENMPKREKSTGEHSPLEAASFGCRQVSPGDKVRLVQWHFDTVAARYDLANTVLSFGLHHVWKRTAVKMMGLKPGDRVIDVCGGTADLTLLASKAVSPSGRVVLYDFNRPMIEVGRSKVAASAGQGNITYIQGDAEHISFRDQSFAAAMVGFGIRNLTDMVRGFKEIHRILQPGGKLMCLEFSQPTAAWFRRLYDFYSFAIMPWVGQLLVGSRQAYTYLSESIRLFLGPAELTAKLESVGFSQVTHRALINGIAVIHLGVKG